MATRTCAGLDLRSTKASAGEQTESRVHFAGVSVPGGRRGKIRTGNILRGLKESGRFDLTLLSPATQEQQREWQPELDRQCERFIGWQPGARHARWQRAPDLLSALPVNVAADRTPAAVSAVEQALAAERFDVVVFDFVHAAVLRPESWAARRSASRTTWKRRSSSATPRQRRARYCGGCGPRRLGRCAALSVRRWP